MGILLHGNSNTRIRMPSRIDRSAHGASQGGASIEYTPPMIVGLMNFDGISFKIRSVGSEQGANCDCSGRCLQYSAA